MMVYNIKNGDLIIERDQEQDNRVLAMYLITSSYNDNRYNVIVLEIEDIFAAKTEVITRFSQVYLPFQYGMGVVFYKQEVKL